MVRRFIGGPRHGELVESDLPRLVVERPHPADRFRGFVEEPRLTAEPIRTQRGEYEGWGRIFLWTGWK